MVYAKAAAPFQPFPNGATYWTSNDGIIAYEKYDETSGVILRPDNTQKYKIRCAWRPE
jgi:hypothetical protein